MASHLLYNGEHSPTSATGAAWERTLSGMPPPLPPGVVRIFPLQLQIGDGMSEATGEWEVVGRPYTAAGGENARVRVQLAEKQV